MTKANKVSCMNTQSKWDWLNWIVNQFNQCDCSRPIAVTVEYTDVDNDEPSLTTEEAWIIVKLEKSGINKEQDPNYGQAVNICKNLMFEGKQAITLEETKKNLIWQTWLNWNKLMDKLITFSRIEKSLLKGYELTLDNYFSKNN